MVNEVPTVARLSIFPIKSLDRVDVEAVAVLKSGALKGDRTFALFDQPGHFVNGKRHDRIHRIRSQYDLQTQQVTLHLEDSDQVRTFHLEQERDRLATYLSDYFGFSVELKQNLEMGFPDDTDSPGPTIVSTATLTAIASWYPDLEVEAVRSRFRANIEIDGVPAFWEDRLFGRAAEEVAFQIGAVQFRGINPCQRCVVVTRDAQTGAVYANFQKTFVAQRQVTLPDWAERSRFNHFFRLAINTRVPQTEVGKTIAIGDRLSLS
uniref:MOSC domain protein beta barrel domain protein n=1 Tax=Cyanothece sp. (strain PCC 7425 / ATCC 29141) TaxID=395961 RepID=B8HQS8_CYAP4